MAGRSAAKFLLSKSSFLLNETIPVRLSHVAEYDKITVTASVKHEQVGYSSYGYFRSPALYQKSNTSNATEGSGAEHILDLAKHRSLGGSYSGIEAMGLFWSMTPDKKQRPGVRLVFSDSRIPMNISLKAFQGHLSPDEMETAEPLCTAEAKRMILPDHVERIPVRHGQIRGTLFRPKRTDPNKKHPAILDLFGIRGGLMEQRSPLLAGEGFVCLTLAFFQYEDLPKRLEVLNLDYFEEGVDYLLSQPDVLGDSVGLIGISKGAEVVHQMAAHMGDKINAVVSINGLAQFASQPMSYKGQIYPVELNNVDMTRVGKTEFGVIYKDVFPIIPPADSQLTPIHKASEKTKFLFVHSCGDLTTPINHVDLLVDSLERAGLGENATIYRYPGAGHLLDPPFAPLCRQAYMKVFDWVVDFGGAPRDHAMAQEDFWHRMVTFLKESNSSKP